MKIFFFCRRKQENFWAEEVRFQSALLIISKGDRDGFPVTFLSSQTFMP